MRHLGWQVLQKFLKERIWICQGQLHGMRLLWTGGAHVSSMQYAPIAYDLQLILAQMGQGRPPPRPWQSVVAWSQALEEAAWRRIDVRDGSKGPLVVEAVKRRVVSRTHRRQQGDEELLTVIRYRDRDRDEVVKVDYYLSNTVPETALDELARVAKAEHRIEECLQRSKSEAGWADYEVRNWTGWQQHQTLSLLATWVLEQETQRGKKMDPG